MRQNPLAFGTMGLVISLAACGNSGGASAPTINAMVAQLNGRLAECQAKGNAAQCISTARTIDGEPPLCAEYLSQPGFESDGRGGKTALPAGSWRVVPTWDLLKTALLDDMPEVQGGLWKSRPLTEVIPPSVDAPPPRQGHFLGAFLPLRGAVGGATREDLDKVDGDSKAFEKALDSRLQSAKDRHGSWALYSKACFETIARSADLLRNDLGTAIEPLRQTKTRLDAEDWVSRAKEECETKASDKTCKAPPNFATAKDKEACEQTCSGAIAAAVDKSYRDAVASCAESFRSSGGTAQASCEFDVPEDATFRMDDYGRRCTQACTLAGKQAIYDDEQRLEAKKQGGSLLFLYNSCMRTAKRSPLVTQWENGNPQKYQHALKREERRCRFDAKCSWLEKYSDRVCKPADAPPT